MKKRVLYLSPLFTLATCFFALLCLPSVSSASSPPADSVSFCLPFDYEQWRRDHPRPAAKPLAALNVGEPLTVRMIYFLPSDRSPQQDIDAKMDSLIKIVQQSYAEVMESHGFGRKTFRFETDGDGKAVVHHVRGKFNDEYYHTETFTKVIYEETAEQFDLSANIYLVVLDVSTATIDGYCGQGTALGGPEGGATLIPAPNSRRLRERGWSCFNVAVSAHELGHAFGLAHDRFRINTRSPSSYHTDRMVTSFCAAEWFDAHRYFNRVQTYPQEDEPTTIQMLPPLAVPPNAIRLRFEVTDPDGLHQAQLHNSTGDAIDCQGISSESASVEFVTLEVTEDPGNRVGLRVVDVYGNVTERWETIDITALLPPENVSIPDANLASLVREALDLTPADAISQLDMLRLGRLEASRRQITDLTGLKHAVNLWSLSLGDNQIRDITPLAGLTLLWSLQLARNSVMDLSPLVGLISIENLELADNRIREITPLTKLIYLVNLDLSGNRISDISPLAELPRLRSLGLNDSNISDLSPLAGLTHLTFLHLGANSVSDLSPLERLTNLEELFLHDNSVSDLSPLAGLTHLEVLWLNVNSVSDLSPLAGLTNLSGLNLDGNSVSDLSPLTELINLQSFYLANNSVSDLSPLAGLIHLRGLELHNNNISDLSPLERLTNLEELGLGGNSFSDLSPLAELPHLTFLYLGANSVSDLSPLERLTNLEGLDLWYNSVSDLSPLAELNRLTFLQIDGNLVSDLSPLVANTGLGDGDVVYVQGNPLSYASIHTHIPILLERGATVNHDNRAHPALLKVSGYNQQGASGVPLAQPFVVAVQDENGSAVEGVQVTFTVTEGGGTLSSTTVPTDAKGQASTTLTLGSQPGPNTVEATVDGFEPVTFTATGKEVHADFDGDGTVGFADFVQFAAQFGLSQDDAGYEARYDLDEDGMIGFGDFVIFAKAFGLSAVTGTAQAGKETSSS